MPVWRNGRLRKRWHYAAAFDERVMLCAARVEVGPLTQSFWAVWDREWRGRHAHTRLRPGGSEVRFEGSLLRIKTRQVRAGLTFAPSEAIEAVCPSPLDGDVERGYGWTRKRAGMDVLGSIKVGRREWTLTDARGVDDVSAGYHQRHTDWLWSAGIGRAVDGASSVRWNSSPASTTRRRAALRAIWPTASRLSLLQSEFDWPAGDWLCRWLAARLRARVRAPPQRQPADRPLPLPARLRHVQRLARRHPAGEWAGRDGAALRGLVNVAADIGSSLDQFFSAASAFFHNLADVGWGALGIALLIYLVMLLARTRAWQNVLRAAYPANRVRYRDVTAAYLAGAGLNGIVPARIGDAVKIMLAHREMPGSTYPALTSSFLVQVVFDSAIGGLVLLYALTQGLLPKLPSLPDLPAFDISFWASHPHFLVFFATALAVGLVIGFIALAARAEQFWARVKQGLVILTDRRRYLREVASWQGVSWICRFFSFWFFLEAFHIGGSVSNVLLVMSVQAISTVLPLTPGGAGAQQALIVATLGAGHSRAAVLSYSVGQQIAVAAWAALLGFIAIFVVYRTTDWRGLMKQAREHRATHAGPQAETGGAIDRQEAAAAATGGGLDGGHLPPPGWFSVAGNA